MKRFLYEIITDQRKGASAALLKAVLWSVSWLYWLGVNITVFMYRAGVIKPRRLPRPVISVGNLTVGGVGKTPLVATLARMVIGKNKKPVILIRGYMGDAKGAPSDEASLLRKMLGGVPVLEGPRRYQNAAEYLKNQDCDVFILDDGFQHWSLARDLDIVAVDANNPWGNGWLLPRGILREPLSAVKRAALVMMTKTDQGAQNIREIKERIGRIAPGKEMIESVHEPLAFVELRRNETKELLLIKSKDICALCSIGAPDSFVRTLTSLGGNVRETFKFPDHHVYASEEIRSITDRCRSLKVSTVITTEKDAVKLEGLLNHFGHELAVYCLKIRTRITSGEDRLLERLDHLLQR